MCKQKIWQCGLIYTDTDIELPRSLLLAHAAHLDFLFAYP